MQTFVIVGYLVAAGCFLMALYHNALRGRAWLAVLNAVTVALLFMAATLDILRLSLTP